MKGILRRPLALASALFLLLLFLALRSGTYPALPVGIVLLLAALLSFGAVFLFVPAVRRPLRRGLFLLAGLFLAASLAFLSAYRVTEYGLGKVAAPYDGTTAEAELTVTQVEYSTAYSTTLFCDLHSLDGQPAALSGRLRLPYAADLIAGDRIALHVDFSALRPDGAELADCYDFSQGILFEATGSEEEYRLLSHSDPFRGSRMEQFRTFLRRQFYPYLSMDETGLVAALLIGDRTYLSPDLSDAFRNLGISHTLAVSGLHLGILCGSLLWIFRRLRLPRVAQLPVLLPFLLFYMTLVGSPSVFRAGGMLLFTFFAYPMGRKRDPLTSLFATVAAICLLSPESVLDIGLLLSFFATFGILLIALPLAEKIRSLPALLQVPLTALTVTASATLFTLPFSVWYFGHFAILSPLANLILVPIITLLLYLAPLLLLLSPFPALSHAPALLIKGISAFLKIAGDFFGGSDHLLLPLNYPVIGTMAIVAIAVVIPLCLFKRTRPLTLAVMVLFLSLAGGYCTLHANALLSERTLLPITDGNNDCLILQVGTRRMIIDHSEGTYAFLAKAVERAELDPLLRVDTLLLTHYHYRQISTLTRLLEGGHLEYLILPQPCEKDENIARTLAERAMQSGCRVRWYSDEECMIGYHDAEIEVDFLSRDDHPLSTVTIRFGEEEFIYSADVTGDPSENALQGTHKRPAVTGDDGRWGKVIFFSAPA